MLKNKRLFLFAAYDTDGIIDNALLMYIRALSKMGDVILYMDSDCKKSELAKLKPYVLYAAATRHGEYDFGSYKRAYQYARDKGILKNYDHIYLANDSVFGPLFDIKKTLQDMESTNTDANGIVIAKHKTHQYMESWFVRLNSDICQTQWFDEFMSTIQHENFKYIITIKYEHGLTNLIHNNGCSYTGLYHIRGRYTYNCPKSLFKRGCPFVKRTCFVRHNGAMGGQIKYILNHCDNGVRNAIMKTANRIYGKEYMDWFLTYNPIKIMVRNIKYAHKKLEDGGI